MRLCENPTCQNELIRRNNEPLKRFEGRRFCSNKCSIACRKQEVWDRIAYSIRERDKTDEGRLSRKTAVMKRNQWMKDNPDQVKKMIEKQSESRRSNGHGKKVSEWTKSFYETDEGKARKERFSQLYKGKIRPPLIRQAMKDGQKRYWNSPEGKKHRETISSRMTQDLAETPYGPGWRDSAYRARERDGKCVVCGATNDITNRALSVHHIYRKRLFGYIPGQNQNYKWANNLANLITLCSVCHTTVEACVVKVPNEYQQNADLLWNEFSTVTN